MGEKRVVCSESSWDGLKVESTGPRMGTTEAAKSEKRTGSSMDR